MDYIRTNVVKASDSGEFYLFLLGITSFQVLSFPGGYAWIVSTCARN